MLRTAAAAVAATFILCGAIPAAPPKVTIHSIRQQGTDVHVTFSLKDQDLDVCRVAVAATDANSLTWDIPVRTVTGDGLVPSDATGQTMRTITWHAGQDVPNVVRNIRIRIFADDGTGPAPMVLVPAGSFPCGNDIENWVSVPSFLIDKYEVTNYFYCQFLNRADPEANHWKPAMEINRLGSWPNYYYTVRNGRENYPVRHVNVHDAEAFAEWRGLMDGEEYRLPTRCEWEKAAAWDPVDLRFYQYACQRDQVDCLWVNFDNCVGGPTPVDYYSGAASNYSPEQLDPVAPADPCDAVSFYGCYGMSGNLAEWTSETVADNRHIARGGAFDDRPNNCTTTAARSHFPAKRCDYIGFRLVREIEPALKQ